jgi:hypothetical protein
MNRHWSHHSAHSALDVRPTCFSWMFGKVIRSPAFQDHRCSHHSLAARRDYLCLKLPWVWSRPSFSCCSSSSVLLVSPSVTIEATVKSALVSRGTGVPDEAVVDTESIVAAADMLSFRHRMGQHLAQKIDSQFRVLSIAGSVDSPTQPRKLLGIHCS